MRTTLVIPVAALAITLSLAGCSLQLPAGSDSTGHGTTQPGTVGIVTGGSPATPAPAASRSAIDPAQDGGTGVPADGSRASVIEIATDELRAYYGPAGLNSDSYENFVYSQDPSEVVAGLTRAFGAAPTASTFHDHPVVGSGTEYSWGGFDLFAGSGSLAGAFAYTFVVDATAATVHGVTVEAGWNLKVGSPISAVRAVANQNQSEDGQCFGLIDMLSYPGSSIGVPVATADTYVLLTANPDSGPITQIDAPMNDF
ncbi:MAG: hypothetical protein ABIO06_03265 [Pseudolysinimonas sp.]